MQHNHEYETYERAGAEPPRSYYIPFGEDTPFAFAHGILDRTKSDRFVSLDGVWQFAAHEDVADAEIDEPLSEEISVPGCVQMHGYDKIQYLNTRYPIPWTRRTCGSKIPRFITVARLPYGIRRKNII